MPTAPASATASECASAISARPTAETAAAPAAQRTGPRRSGRSPPIARVMTTVVANAANAVAPWPTCFELRSRTMNEAIAA